MSENVHYIGTPMQKKPSVISVLSWPVMEWLKLHTSPMIIVNLHFNFDKQKFLQTKKKIHKVGIVYASHSVWFCWLPKGRVQARNLI